MIPGYMTIKEASEKWGISVRSINNMCHNGKILDAQMFARTWAIPSGTEKPMIDRREKTGAYKDWRKKYGKAKNSTNESEIMC